MENADSNEPERKQPHLTSVSSAMARNSTPSSPNNKSEKCPSRISKLESQVFRLEEELKKVQDELEAIQKQNAVDPIAVAPAMNEIQQLKVQHEIITDYEAATTKHIESTNAELQSLKGNHAEFVSHVQTLTALVLKGIEFNQKLRPGLENLTIQSKALWETCFSQEKQICQLQHQLLVSNQKLKELEDGRGRSPKRSLEDEEDLQEGH